MTKKVTEIDLMPFGLFKGKPLKEVPTHHLFSLYNNNLLNEGLNEYMEANWEVLTAEMLAK